MQVKDQAKKVEEDTNNAAHSIDNFVTHLIVNFVMLITVLVLSRK